MKIKTTCKSCKKNFEVNETEIKRGWGKFCSISCSVIYNNIKRTNGRKQKGKHVKCHICGKRIYRKMSLVLKYKRFFCKRACQTEYRKMNEKDRNRRRRLLYQYKKIIDNIKEKRGNICQICSWAEATCDAHHIKPISEGGKNIPRNVIILCPNHHRLADFGIISRKKLREWLRDIQ